MEGWFWGGRVKMVKGGREMGKIER